VEPLLVFPDPLPPEVTTALDGAGYPHKGVLDERMAAALEPDDGWAGAVIIADADPEAAFALCRRLRHSATCRSSRCCSS
jgi:hypothetical protein